MIASKLAQAAWTVVLVAIVTLGLILGGLHPWVSVAIGGGLALLLILLICAGGLDHERWESGWERVSGWFSWW